MEANICAAIIVAGGKGLRLDPTHPKQYLPLAGKPILIHTLERFYDSGLFERAVVVLPAADLDFWPELCARHRLDRGFFEATAGGATRFDSVLSGLNVLNRYYSAADERADRLWVAVHDGVRPFIDTAFLQACLQAAFQYGNAVPALPPVESFRYLETETATSTATADPTQATASRTPTPANRPIDRDRLRQLQTPQCARLSRLLTAFRLTAALPETEKAARFTDEATVLEYAGDRIHLCEGSPINLKITRPIDLTWAEAILKDKL